MPSRRTYDRHRHQPRQQHTGVMMLHWRVFPRNRLQITRRDRRVCCSWVRFGPLRRKDGLGHGRYSDRRAFHLSMCIPIRPGVFSVSRTNHQKALTAAKASPSMRLIGGEHGRDSRAAVATHRKRKPRASDEDIQFLFISALIDDDDLRLQILERFFKDIRKRLSN